jgi:hypothetical protein
MQVSQRVRVLVHVREVGYVKSTGVRGVCEVNIVLSCPYHSAQPSKLVGATGVLAYSACSAPLR